MNERIKELIEQAGIESYPAKLLVNADKEGKVSSKWEIPLEKFAELIVAECAEWIKNTDSDPDIGEEDAKALLEHFGVEE